MKKTVLSAYGNPRRVGLNAINILEGDELIDVQLSDGNCQVVLATHQGMAIRFPEQHVREMGRATTGVRGISLEEGDFVVGMVVVKEAAHLWWTSRAVQALAGDSYRLQRRAEGVINVKRTDRTGHVGRHQGRAPATMVLITRRVHQPPAVYASCDAATPRVNLINLGRATA